MSFPITPDNCTDFRTKDGIRVVRCLAFPTSLSSGNSLLLKFERPFRLSAYGSLRDDWYVHVDTGFIPASDPEMRLVYDPLPKAAVPVLNSFWLVWRPGGSNPSFRHPTEVAAVREAERLSALNPGSEFFVLKMTSRTSTERPKVNTAFAL